MKSNVEEIVKQYLGIFPNERENLQKLNIFLEVNKNNYNNLFNRKNFDGHITSSGYVFSKKEKKFLLLQHKQLNVYIQPGGHVELEDETILDSAKREMFEETGLKDLTILNPSNNIFVPFNINTHYIPKNDEKNESEHFHHDFCYLFIIDSIQDIKIDFNESNGFKWCSINEIKDRSGVKNKLVNFLNIER